MKNLLNNRNETKHRIADGGFGEDFSALNHILKIDVALKRLYINTLEAKSG